MVDFSVVVVSPEPGALPSVRAVVVVVLVDFSETSGLTGAPGTLGSAGAPAAPCGLGAPGSPAGSGIDEVCGTVVSFTVSLQPAMPIEAHKAVTAIIVLAIFILISPELRTRTRYAASRCARISKRSSINSRVTFNLLILSVSVRPPVVSSPRAKEISFFNRIRSRWQHIEDILKISFVVGTTMYSTFWVLLLLIWYALGASKQRAKRESHAFGEIPLI